MARPPRFLFENAFYHVFNRGVEKRSLFLDDRDRRTFLAIFSETVHFHQIRLYAFCLMENHYHFYLSTPLPNLDQAMQSFQSQYVHYFNFRHQRVGGLFQGRYKSPIVDSNLYSLTLIRYIHRNPLDAGIVEKIGDYPWSSYPVYKGDLPEFSWLNTEWILSQFGKNSQESRFQFEKFHQGSIQESERKVFESSKPYRSSKEFYESLAQPMGSDPRV